MILRKFQPEDIDEIVRIEQECFPKIGWSKDRYLNALEDCDGFRICEIDGKIAGYVLTDICVYTAHITTLNVASEFRRQGVGKTLLEWVRFNYLHYKYISLEVAVDNNNAIMLYEKAGYYIVTEVDDYYDEGENAYVMVRQSTLKCV